MSTVAEEGRKEFLKPIASGLIILIILMIAGCRPGGRRAADKGDLEGDVSISSSFALYPLILKLTDDFHATHPGVQFDISAGGTAKCVSDTLNGLVDLGGISREVHPQEKERGLWSVAIARDAVLAIVSENNLYLHDLLRKGASKDALARIWIAGDLKDWGEMLGGPTSQPIHDYTRADLCGAGEIWGLFLGGSQEDLQGIGVHGESWMAGAVRRDPLGIGYTNLNFAYDARTLAPVSGISILPIDFDGNGRIDAEEDFYSSRTQVLEAIASQKYPSPPSRDLYLVCDGAPRRECVREFLVWALTQGQAYISGTGYIPLPGSMLEESLRSLADR